MGCDIHAFVEVREHGMWHCFAELHLRRDYRLFNLIAGVRNDGDEQPSFEPRGFPGKSLSKGGWCDDVSWRVKDKYTVIVAPDNEQADNTCSAKTAAKWVKSGSSEAWHKDAEGNVIRVSHPDWHTPTWLTTEEVGEIVERSNSTEIRGIYQMMKALGGECRLVCWFDN